jgi:hypothetical protein
VLLGYTDAELDGDEEWSCPIAGGRRTVKQGTTLSTVGSAAASHDQSRGRGDDRSRGLAVRALVPSDRCLGCLPASPRPRESESKATNPPTNADQAPPS